MAHPQRPSALTGCILFLQVPWDPPHPTMGPPSFIVSFCVCGDRESSESSHATLLWMVMSSSSFAISPFSMLHPSPCFTLLPPVFGLVLSLTMVPNTVMGTGAVTLALICLCYALGRWSTLLPV